MCLTKNYTELKTIITCQSWELSHLFTFESFLLICLHITLYFYTPGFNKSVHHRICPHVSQTAVFLILTVKAWRTDGLRSPAACDDTLAGRTLLAALSTRRVLLWQTFLLIGQSAGLPFSKERSSKQSLICREVSTLCKWFKQSFLFSFIFNICRKWNKCSVLQEKAETNTLFLTPCLDYFCLFHEPIFDTQTLVLMEEDQNRRQFLYELLKHRTAYLASKCTKLRQNWQQN